MVYFVESEKAGDAERAAQYIIDMMDESYYDDMLDEVYGDIEICGYTYAASTALFRIDRVAYDCGMSDYEDSIYGDIVAELEEMDADECREIYGCEVAAYADDEQ